VLNFTHAQRPLLLVPIGAAYFALYYGVFRFCIVRLNLSTPGREADDNQEPIAPVTAGTRGEAFVTALGGARNLTEVAACTTRLRLELADNRAIDERTLKQLGARGLLRSSSTGLQVVLGPIADQVAGEIRDAVRAGAGAGQVPRHEASQAGAAPATGAASPARAEATNEVAATFLAAMGGRKNLAAVESSAGRLLLRVADSKAVDEHALGTLGVRGIARPSPGSVQVLVAGPVENWAGPLNRLLAMNVKENP
jgi:N-acetylglucosamine PTS system EIICBA or EIICB component